MKEHGKTADSPSIVKKLTIALIPRVHNFQVQQWSASSERKQIARSPPANSLRSIAPISTEYEHTLATTVRLAGIGGARRSSVVSVSSEAASGGAPACRSDGRFCARSIANRRLLPRQHTRLRTVSGCLVSRAQSICLLFPNFSQRYGKQEEKSSEAIRTVVQLLRKESFRAAAMTDVAEAIDGSNHGHYGLILARNK